MTKKIYKKLSKAKTLKTKSKKAAETKAKKTGQPFVQSLRWLSAYGRYISLIGGVIVVCLWTLIRHISNGINFDVVGQVGVAQQWAHGHMSGTQLGATSYLLKMPVYFALNCM